jgi:branched-chain amino acid transport system substrate-binding protein
VTDYTGLLTAAKALNPDVVYYGGVTTGGGGLLRKQMVAAGMADIPLIGGDGIVDGPPTAASSFLNLSGAQGDVNTFGTVAAAHDIPNAGAFEAKYKTAFGVNPGAYSAAAYACTQIFLDAFKQVGKPDRAGIRQYVTSGASFDTVLGTISFDKNGDTTQQIISEYKYDASNSDPQQGGGPGKPGWLFVKQTNFSAPGAGSASPAASGG